MSDSHKAKDAVLKLLWQELDLGHETDSSGAYKCVYCGKKASAAVNIQHAEDCLQGKISAVLSPSNEDALRLQREIARRTKGLEWAFKTVCLCGSSRFCDLIAVVAWEFEKLGILAYGMHLLPNWYEPQLAAGQQVSDDGGHYAEAEGVAKMLDSLHFKKIAAAEAVFVVNYGGYIGEQTKKEIAHAHSLGKRVHYLEDR